MVSKMLVCENYLFFLSSSSKHSYCADCGIFIGKDHLVTGLIKTFLYIHISKGSQKQFKFS